MSSIAVHARPIMGSAPGQIVANPIFRPTTRSIAAATAWTLVQRHGEVHPLPVAQPA